MGPSEVRPDTLEVLPSTHTARLSVALRTAQVAPAPKGLRPGVEPHRPSIQRDMTKDLVLVGTCSL